MTPPRWRPSQASIRRSDRCSPGAPIGPGLQCPPPEPTERQRGTSPREPGHHSFGVGGPAGRLVDPGRVVDATHRARPVDGARRIGTLDHRGQPGYRVGGTGGTIRSDRVWREGVFRCGGRQGRRRRPQDRPEVPGRRHGEPDERHHAGPKSRRRGSRVRRRRRRHPVLHRGLVLGRRGRSRFRVPGFPGLEQAPGPLRCLRVLSQLLGG